MLQNVKKALANPEPMVWTPPSGLRRHRKPDARSPRSRRRTDLSGARNNLEGRFHITDWTTNPNFLAAYSAMLPGLKRRNPLVIGNLVFAGETFVQDLKKSPSQMTGAWESGRIAGKKILTKLALEARRGKVGSGPQSR
jgi:hypothetical protein